MGKASYGERKKLSWTYRRKAKLQNAKNLETNASNSVGTESKNTRIIVRNLPFKITDEDVRRLYEPFGEIKEINLLRHPDGKLVGCGFVQFNRVEDASKAIFNTNKKEFLGRTINSDWAISKSKFCKKLEKDLSGDQGTSKESSSQKENIQEKDHKSSNAHRKEKDALRKHKRRKLQKMKKQKKRARIVIRNLSFQITEDNLKEHFSKYGEIEEMKILMRPDGKCTGCAFMQFNHVQSAAKAIHYANMQTLLDRSIVVDWAVPRSKFVKNNMGEDGIKSEIKIEATDENEAQNVSMKCCYNEDRSKNIDTKQNSNANREEIIMESIEIKDELDEHEIKHEEEDTDVEDEDANDNNDNDDDTDENDNDSTMNVSVQEEEERDQMEKETCFDSERPRRVSNDVSEGKTIFLKNVPFSVNNNELKKYMEQFGPVQYALVCIDHLTEHSRGSAFVKFMNVADAEKCLTIGTELRMHDQVIEAHRALHRKEVENKKSLKEQRIKDSRNLYLIKEGVVWAGSPAATEVSVSDMEKRLKLEQWKSQMLRNLNMFVSRVRLAVHNLPSNLDDAKLRQLFKNHSGPKAIIREARVMRNLKTIDATGRGQSKEYGFVTFTSHEDALRALRSINNNPNIFSKSKRPIIGFSIENRILVNAKEKRIQKSRERNPLWSGNKGKRKHEDTAPKEAEVPTKRVKIRKSNDSNEKSYTGITGRLGQDKLRSVFNLKSQAALHMRAMKKEKKLSKTTKQIEIMRKEKMKRKGDNMLVEQKKKKLNADDANFNKLVNSYRNKLKNIDLKKQRWHETVNES